MNHYTLFPLHPPLMNLEAWAPVKGQGWWNRNPRPQLEPQITGLDKCKTSWVSLDMYAITEIHVGVKDQDQEWGRVLLTGILLPRIARQGAACLVSTRGSSRKARIEQFELDEGFKMYHPPFRLAWAPVQDQVWRTRTGQTDPRPLSHRPPRLNWPCCLLGPTLSAAPPGHAHSTATPSPSCSEF